MRKMSEEEFIDKCIKKHGTRYDYSLTNYVNSRTKVSIICKKHGIFEQLPKHHYNGQNCPRCFGNLNLLKEEFIKMSNRNEYSYDLLPEIIKMKNTIRIINIENGLIYHQLVNNHLNGLKPTKIESTSLVKTLKTIHQDNYEYVIDREIYRLTEKILIVDNETGEEFEYRVDRHLKGMCPNKVTLRYFIVKSKKVHSNKYDYSLVKEINGIKNKVDIICPEHGVYRQRVSNHMNLKDGCPMCVGKGKWNTEILKEYFNKVHLNKYDYTNVIFSGVSNKVEIICNLHGSFLQNIHKHLKGQGCPECTFNSKGEEYIKSHLEDLKIKYIRQHGFDSCRFKNKLSFDFYLPELDTCVEFDGIQHFKPVEEFGGLKEFEKIKLRDECKNKWCLENNINLIRIRYDQIDRIREMLTHLLNVK